MKTENNGGGKSHAALTSKNPNCISTQRPIYLDACKVSSYLRTTAGCKGTYSFSPLNRLLFSQRSFNVRPDGNVFINRSVGTNGAFLERFERGEYQYIGKDESNQLTEFEKDRLLLMCGSRQPWELQRDQFSARYSGLIKEIAGDLRQLTVFQPKLNECEFYIELPLFRIDDDFDDHFVKKITSAFGATDIERDRSGIGRIKGLLVSGLRYGLAEFTPRTWLRAQIFSDLLKLGQGFFEFSL